MEGGSNLWGAGFMNCIVVEVLHCGVGGDDTSIQRAINDHEMCTKINKIHIEISPPNQNIHITYNIM